MKQHVQAVVDHLWGPTGSVLLHILIVFLAVKFFHFATAGNAPDVEVKMMEIETIDVEELEELKKEIEDLQIEDIEIDVDVPTDVPQPEDISEFAQDDANVDFDALDVMSDINSPLVMDGLFSGRTKGGRASMLRKYGGRWAERTEKSVLSALRWLKEHQEDDGSWKKNTIAMTGLGLLTFLAHGETPSSEEFGETVEKAIKYLITQQKPDGYFGNAKANGPGTYAHAIATYALSEAYAMSRIPAIKPVVEKSVQGIISGQQSGGGWDYGYAKAARRDTSVSGWHIQALKAAYLAGADNAGLKDSMIRSVRDLRSVYNAGNNKFGYTSRNSGTWRMTGVGTLCMQLLGYSASTEAKGGIKGLVDVSADWDKEGHLYGWYYVTQAKFHAGGATWTTWNNKFAKTLTEAQEPDGHWEYPTFGTGNSKHEHGHNEGPVYSTTLAALTLQVYYRNLPTFSEEAVKEENFEVEATEDDVVIEII